MANDPNDPRVLVLQEMRKQTALLALMQQNLTAMAGTLLDMADRQASDRLASPVAPPVNDRLCDAPHGDPIVRQKDPRDWTGDVMTGKRFSECPAEYLDLLADRYDYFASRETDDKKQKYNLLDASRARAWAQRKRNGWTEPIEPVAEGEPRW